MKNIKSLFLCAAFILGGSSAANAFTFTNTGLSQFPAPIPDDYLVVGSTWKGEIVDKNVPAMNQIAFEHQQPGFPDPFPVAQVAKSIELDAKHVFEFAVPASEKLSISNAYIISNELADSEVKVEAWLEGQLVYSKAFMINSSEIKILGFGMNSIVDRFRITSDNEYLVQQFNYQNNSFENSQSRCIGEACEEGEVFLFDALRLKEDNIRLHFQSSLYSDWRILINDIEENGENYFAVEDSDRNIVPFKLMAGAKEDSLVCYSDWCWCRLSRTKCGT